MPCFDLAMSCLYQLNSRGDHQIKSIHSSLKVTISARPVRPKPCTTPHYKVSSMLLLFLLSLSSLVVVMVMVFISFSFGLRTTTYLQHLIVLLDHVTGSSTTAKRPRTNNTDAASSERLLWRSPMLHSATLLMLNNACTCVRILFCLKHEQGRPEPLSKLTVASLEDIGYIVDPSMVSVSSLSRRF